MSRRRLSGIIIGCLLLALALIFLDQSYLSSKRQLWYKSEEQASARDFEKYHGKTFTVVNVVDGDTIDIDKPDGQYEHTRIRLWGVDTPETKHPEKGEMYFGPQAAEFTEQLAMGKQVAVYLDEGNRTRDKYARLLAYVQFPDKSFLNEVLLIEGFAFADVRFHHSFYNKYKQLEAIARSQKKGLWPHITPEQMPEWRKKEISNIKMQNSK